MHKDKQIELKHLKKKITPENPQIHLKLKENFDAIKSFPITKGRTLLISL